MWTDDERAELSEAYGQHWQDVCRVLEQASQITKQELDQLYLLSNTVSTEPSVAALSNARNAAYDVAEENGCVEHLRAARMAGLRTRVPGAEDMATFYVVAEYLPVEYRVALCSRWLKVFGKTWRFG